MHRVRSSNEAWLRNRRLSGRRVVAVEVAEGALALTFPAPAREPTVLLPGGERHGLPDEVTEPLDEVAEMAMMGRGDGPNAAVAGSLVLYRLAGLS